MGKWIKRIGLSILVLFVLVIGAMVAIPYFYKDEILTLVKEQANAQLNATLDFKDVELSFFKSFPSFTVSIVDYDIKNKAPFEGMSLAKGERLDVGLDFWSVVGDQSTLKIQNVFLEKPNLHVLVLADGRANYDITLPSSDTTEATAFVVELQKYGMNQGNIIYDDRTMPFKMELTGFDHSGKGDFTMDVFDLDTESTISAMSMSYDGVSYLTKVKTVADAVLNINLGTSTYTLKDNTFKINDLVLDLNGYLAMPAQDIDMNMTFKAPSTNFKDLWSILPGVYTKDYADVKANGTFTLDGFVKGRYNERSYPAFEIKTNLKGGSVQYPGMPLSVNNVNAAVAVISPSSQLKDLKIDIPQFALKIGNNPLEGYLKLSQPMTNPTVDTKIKGTLNLAELSKAVPMEGVEALTGIIKGDVTIKADMATLDKGEYEKTQVDGQMTLSNLQYKAADMPKVTIAEASAKFSPAFVDIPNFKMTLGRSDMEGSARIDNILAYFSPEKTMKGKVTLRSNLFDANEWMTEEPARTAPVAPTTAAVKPFDRFDFDLDAFFKLIQYDTYAMKNTTAKGNMTSNALQIGQFSTAMGASDFAVTGNVSNIFNYLYENETLLGDIKLDANTIDLNAFMTEAPVSATSTAPAVATEPFVVPNNIQMSINSSIGKVLYTDMELTNVKGIIAVGKSQVNMKDVAANFLGGDIMMTGQYDTKNPEKPAFALDYGMNKMDFQKVFNKFNSFKTLAPIGTYLTGMFDTRLNMSGTLGKDLTPQLDNLSANGFLATIEAALRNFEPLQKVGNMLDIDAFKNFEIKNTKNWIEIKNGMVELKPFKYVLDGIDMQIGGKHGLTQDMDYQIIAKIPRSKMGNAANAVANKGIGLLSKEASKVGLNLEVGEFVNVQINLTGNMKSPKVGLKVLGTDGKSSLKDQASASLEKELEAQRAKLEKEAEAKLNEGKARVDKAVDKAKDSVTTVVNKKVDEAVDKVKDKVGDEIGKKVEEKIGDKVPDAAKSAAQKAKEEADKLKDKIPNPFGKKKGN